MYITMFLGMNYPVVSIKNVDISEVFLNNRYSTSKSPIEGERNLVSSGHHNQRES